METKLLDTHDKNEDASGVSKMVNEMGSADTPSWKEKTEDVGPTVTSKEKLVAGSFVSDTNAGLKPETGKPSPEEKENVKEIEKV